MKRRSTIAAFLLLMFVGIASAQVTNEGKPMSWKAKSLKNVEAYEMPKINLEKFQAEDKVNDTIKSKPWRYGHEFLVDHNLQNSGNWTTLPNGDRVWRIRYTSEGAQTMNFLFSDYYMPEGGKVYLYNNDRTDLLGAYDAGQNNEKRELGTWLVKGSDIWIEYYEPAAVTGQGKLEIFKVVHGYRSLGIVQKSPDDGLNASGDCNYDVNCFMDGIDGLKDINKKSVALIIVSNSAFCTGALINNTSSDGTPYFLTANHCVENQDVSQWAFRFNWISTNPVCAGSAPSTSNDPNYYQTVSGAELKAKNAETDFALLEITADLPDTWDLVWAGWDRSETPAQSTFGIHHAAGDIMKACRDFDAPILDDNFGFMWRVADWDLGVTQGGSSGSPLFNQDGRIIGQLYGGYADCDGNEDNGGADFYGRFYKSWNSGATASTRLKEWLDPINTDAMTVGHYPVQSTFAINARVIIPGLEVEGCNSNVQPVIKLINKGTQNLTSAQISYTFNDVSAVINWDGNLAIAAAADIELPEFTNVDGENNLIINILQPNGQTDEDASDNSASGSFISHVYPITDVLFFLMTDKYGNETSWELKNEQGEVLYEGDNYGDFDNDIRIFRLPEAGCYTFTIFDEYGDGICCNDGEGHYMLKTEGGVEIQKGSSFGKSESVSFRLDEVLSSEDVTLKSSIKVYPNPSAGIFNIVSENNLDYRLSNMLGQVIKRGNLNQNGTVDISANASGVYMLNVTDVSSGKTANYKLVKQ